MKLYHGCGAQGVAIAMKSVREKAYRAQPLIALIAFERRDLVRAAALAWITLWAAAMSSFFTSAWNSVWLFSSSLAAIASRTLRSWVRRLDLVERLRMRRTASCRMRFLALAVLGMVVVSCRLLVVSCQLQRTTNN